RFADASMRMGALVKKVATNLESKFAVTDQIVLEIIECANVNDIRIIWLCSPNNPTGVPIADKHIARICRETKALVVLDSVFWGIDEQIKNQVGLVKRFPNLVILRSLSKIDGGAGLRIGAAFGNPETIAPIESWRLPFNIPTASLTAGRDLLQAIGENHNAKTIIPKERERMFEAISAFPSFEIGAPSDTSIFLLRHKTEDLFTLLRGEYICVADMRRTTGLEGMRFVRITIQSQKENNRLLTALTNIQKNEAEGR
ncbi:MAG: aminotransferase class I/II-fold pyridoxal phosphate-dependent enzyme, partial [Patescibacteria group bacterium]